MLSFVAPIPASSRLRVCSPSCPRRPFRSNVLAVAPAPLPRSYEPVKPSSAEKSSSPPASTQAWSSRAASVQLAVPELPSLTSFAIPRLLALLVAVLWSSNFACVRLLDLGVLPTADAAFARFAVSAAVLLPSLFSSPLPSELIGHGAACGFWISLGYICQAIALQTTGAGKAAFICSLSVVFVPFVIKLFPGLSVTGNAESSHGRKAKPSWIAAGLAAAGVGVMELGGSGLNSGVQMGDLWAFLMMCGFGMGFVENEKALNLYPENALQLTALQLTVVALTSALWSFGSASMLAGSMSLPDLSPLWDFARQGWDWKLPLAVLYTGIVTTAGTIWLENIALKDVSASEMAVILTTEPLFASAIAATFLGERLGPEAMFGGALILSACALNQIKNSSSEFGDDETTLKWSAGFLGREGVELTRKESIRRGEMLGS